MIKPIYFRGRYQQIVYLINVSVGYPVNDFVLFRWWLTGNNAIKWKKVLNVEPKFIAIGAVKHFEWFLCTKMHMLLLRVFQHFRSISLVSKTSRNFGNISFINKSVCFWNFICKNQCNSEVYQFRSNSSSVFINISSLR